MGESYEVKGGRPPAGAPPDGVRRLGIQPSSKFGR